MAGLLPPGVNGLVLIHGMRWWEASGMGDGAEGLVVGLAIKIEDLRMDSRTLG